MKTQLLKSFLFASQCGIQATNDGSHHNFDPGVAAAAGGNLCRSRGSTEGEVGEYGEGTAAVMSLSLGLFFFFNHK